MSDNIHIIKLGAYTTPEVVENHYKEWVEYGTDNDYFNYLISRAIGSTTNQALLKGISDRIYGNGLKAKDSNRKPSQWAKVISMLSKEDLRKFVTDHKMLGMAAMMVTYEKGEPSKIAHFPMETLRPEKATEKGVIEAWYYHPDWANAKPSDEPKRIPSFGQTDQKKDEIYILQPYMAGHYYFSPVDYQGGLPYAVLEEEVGDYLINDVQNGFSASKVVNFNNGYTSNYSKDNVYYVRCVRAGQ